MVTDVEKKEKMLEFFRMNAYNPLIITPPEFKKRDKSTSE
jgi:hypothetical protein